MKMRKCQPFFSEQEIPAGGWGVITFSKPAPTHKGLTLDLGNVVTYMREHGWYQRSPTVLSYDHDLPFDGEVSRIRSLIGYIRGGGQLPPVKLYVSEVGGICFSDGRHRITLLHAAGYKTIEAEVPSKDVAEIANALGWQQSDNQKIERQHDASSQTRERAQA